MSSSSISMFVRTLCTSLLEGTHGSMNVLLSMRSLVARKPNSIDDQADCRPTSRFQTTSFVRQPLIMAFESPTELAMSGPERYTCVKKS